MYIRKNWDNSYSIDLETGGLGEYNYYYDYKKFRNGFSEYFLISPAQEVFNEVVQELRDAGISVFDITDCNISYISYRLNYQDPVFAIEETPGTFELVPVGMDNKVTLLHSGREYGTFDEIDVEKLVYKILSICLTMIT